MAITVVFAVLGMLYIFVCDLIHLKQASFDWIKSNIYNKIKILQWQWIISKFIDWRKQSGLSPVKTSDIYGVPYNDPNVVSADEFEFDLCGSVLADIPENEQGLITKTIPAGRCARVRHFGSRDDIDTPIYYLYGQWLPKTDEELRDFPVFFHYINMFPEVDEHELITDIYLPLK